MKRSKQHVWEEGRRIAATLPDESDAVVLEDHDFSTSDDEDRTPKTRSHSDLQSALLRGIGSLSSTPQHAESASEQFLRTEYQEDDRRRSPERQRDLTDKDVLDKGLYIILISLHGLIRGERMELGKDPDTGGQVRSLKCHALVGKVTQSNFLKGVICMPKAKQTAMLCTLINATGIIHVDDNVCYVSEA